MPNDYLNRDPFAGAVLNNPDPQTFKALALYEAGQFGLLKDSDWTRISERLNAERESNAAAMKSGQRDAQRGLNTPNAQTYLASRPQAPRSQVVNELMQQPQQMQKAPWTPRNLPGPDDMVTYNNVPGYGDVTVYGGRYDQNTPRPAPGYGYAGGVNPATGEPSYVNITPQGIVRGSTPMMGPQGQPVQQAVSANPSTSAFEELVRGKGFPYAAPQSLLPEMNTGGFAQSKPSGSAASQLLPQQPATFSTLTGKQSSINLPALQTKQEDISSYVTGMVRPQQAPPPQAITPSVKPSVVAGLLLGDAFGKKALASEAKAPAPLLSDQETAEGSPYQFAATQPQTPQSQVTPSAPLAPTAMPVQQATAGFQQVDTSADLAQKPTTQTSPVGYRPLEVPAFKPSSPFDPVNAYDVVNRQRAKNEFEKYNKSVQTLIDINKHNLAERREAYKEGRDAVKDSLEIALKGTQIQKEQLGLVSERLKLMFRADNKPAELNIGGKNLIVIPTGPDTTRVIEVKPDTSPSEKTAMVKVAYNQQLQDAVASGDLATAERAFSVLNPGWMATNSTAFQIYVDERMKAMGKGKPAPSVPKKGQAPAAKTQAPKQGAAAQPQIRYDREGRAVQLINGPWVLVQ